MKRIFNFFNSTSLFVRVASIMLSSIILVSICISSIIISISKKTLVDTFSKSNYKVLTQISQNFYELNDKIITKMNIISDSTDFQNYLTKTDMTPQFNYKTIYNMNKTISSTTTVDDSINITLCVIGLNGNSYVQNSDCMLLSSNELLNDDITKNALENPNKIFYQFIPKGYTTYLQNTGGLVAIKVLHDKFTREIYGLVYAFINQEYIKKYYLPFVGNGNNISIISEDGTIISSNLKSQIGTKDLNLYNISNKVLEDNLTYLNTRYNSSDVAILSQHLPTYNFNIVGMIDKNTVLDEIYDTWQILLVSLLIALFFVIILFFIIKRTTRPISTLANTMPKIVNGNFNNHISIKGCAEVRQLCSAFNYMLDGLNSYIDQKMKIQKEKRKAEISALQMQINPHFIYNTLSSIKWLVWQENVEKSSQTIDAFISLLQNTISNKNEMITIEEEIENLKNYVLINHVRYGDKITVNFFIMPQCEKYIIPKLILQPFIENSFFHAFTDKDFGSIHVLVNVNDDKLICEIIDNGIGMSSENVQNILRDTTHSNNHFTSIGINNVNDRIKLLYGDNYGVTISSELSKGTIVKLIIPALTEYVEPN